jgi:glutamine cyclotransferase
MIFEKTKYIVTITLTFILLLGASCNSKKKEEKIKIYSDTSQISKQTNKDTAKTEIKTSNTPDVFTEIKIIRELNHDTQAYTQGLIYHNGYLYESTGQYRKSSLRKIDPKTGKILFKTPLADNYFAEGIAIFNNKLYQLTWRSSTGFIYDLMTLRQTGTFSYYGEGWGITSDGKNLIMSDGTNALRFLDPKTLEIVKTVFVVDKNSYPLNYLNELEYINGEIWANVYMKNFVVRINPDDGKVTSVVDLSFLLKKIELTPDTDVLNGIAYDKKHDEYYFTGKNWNKIFVIKMN